MAVCALVAWMAPGSAVARVNPLNIIQQQIQKPNMLILFDTSGSMNLLPNSSDMDMHEAGMDCDDGDAYCRTVGKKGRCYMTMSGKSGPGVVNDAVACTVNTDCTKAGLCRHGGTFCTTDSSCADNTCGWVANNFCVTTDPVPPATLPLIQMCVLGQNMCRTKALDCNVIAGDDCGPATSRLLIAKRALRQVVQDSHQMVNFGFMTFKQAGYYPYFKATGVVTDLPAHPAFLSRAELEFAGCFSPSTGPKDCTINFTTYTLNGAPSSRYRVNLGTSYDTQDRSWDPAGGCTELCPMAGVGTGMYLGSYYTYRFWRGGPADKQDSTTLLTFPDYVGRKRLSGGFTYIYLDAPRSKRNVNNIFGNEIDDDTDFGLSYVNEAFWDVARVPFMDTSAALPLANAITMATKISGLAEKVSLGGLYPYGGTPSGTALKSPVSTAKERSAYSYLVEVQKQNVTNSVGCRPNSVLFITDGIPTGADDVACDSAACSASPPTAACTCAAVMSAYAIFRPPPTGLGAKVYVIGFSGTLSSVAEKTSINNIAKAGGSLPFPAGCVGAACNYAYFASREADLQAALSSVMYDAAKGSYSTSPATGSSGSQNAAGVITAGTLLLDARVDFPTWKGNLIAYDLSAATPSVAWSAASVTFNATADPAFWKKRNVWTSETVSGVATMIKIQVDQTTGAITNKTKLTALGLGVTDAESELVARWMLGDPALGNPAVLGAIVNSTPIDVGPPGGSPLPGGDAFFASATMKARPFLTYAGSSDGMLHAFSTKNQTVGSKSYLGGQEAFAYIPQDMLKVIKKLYVQGGQLPGPKDHVYGLASSPKVKNLCTANCTSAGSAVWKTLLTMTEGNGGNEVFVLDITDPHTTTGIRDAISDPPVKQLLWHSEYLSSASQKADYDSRMGQTASVPAVYLSNSGSLDDYRMLFASGYGDGVSTTQGQYLVSVKATTGEPVTWDTPTNKTTCANPGLEHAFVTDVATGRRFLKGENGQMAAAYFGDPWGQLWRYTPNGSPRVKDVALFTCSHPLHFAPTVVQLDRDDPSNHSGEVYLVQVTNSALDPVTAYSATYPASKLVFKIDEITSSDVIGDTFPGGATEVVRTVGVSTEICAVTGSGGTTCITPMPINARPTSTPLAVLKQDNSGFQVITLWYVPGAGGCNKGTTYMTMHEFVAASASVTQKYGGWLAAEPVTSAVFVGAKLVFADSSGAKDTSTFTGIPKFLTYTATSRTPSADRFRRISWQELP